MTNGLKAELAAQIAAGRVLVVVGTGVSLAATASRDHPRGHPLASWKGLLRDGVEHCVGHGFADAKWGERQKEALDGDLDDLLGVAEQVSRRLGWERTDDRCRGDWTGWLRRTVGGLRVEESRLIEAVRDLGAPIATLNYDDLLTKVTGRRPLTWQQAARWLPVLDGKDEAILHLHGHWDQPSSVVLGIRAYDAVLGAELAQHLQRALASLRSLVFIGCGGTFGDPNFGVLLDWLREHLHGAEHHHYLLVRRGDALPLAEAQLRAARVFPVPYGDAHTDLLPFVQGLAPKRASDAFSGGATPRAGHAPLSPLAAHNLPPANPDFVGREAVLDELRRLLTGGRGLAVLTQAIVGLGGIGKTQTALAYCYRHLADHKLVWWLRAESAEVLAADYAGLAGPLGLDPATASQEELVGAIRGKLQVADDWLLVFDNVDADLELPAKYLPAAGRGHALITSRRTDWFGRAKELPLDLMPEAEALRLLAERQDPDVLPPAELAEAKALAEDLGYLPLALAMARAYMTATGRGFAAFRRLFAESRPDVLNRERPSPDYPASIARTWQVSIDAAAAACPASRPLLEILAFFAPDALPTAVLASEPAALPEGLRGELKRDEAVAALNRFSLIRAEADAITVHRLVQAVTRDGLDGATAAARAEAAVRLVGAALPDEPQEHTRWSAVATLLPHMLAAAEAAERLQAGLEAAAGVLNGAARYHHARAIWGEAEPLYRRALAIREKVLGPEHPDVAMSLNDLAVLHREIGRPAEAEPLLVRALAIHERVLGPEHPDTGKSLGNLAVLYADKRQHAKARPLLVRALAITEKVFGSEHPNVAWWLRNLIAVCRATGFHGKARRLEGRLAAIRRGPAGGRGSRRR